MADDIHTTYELVVEAVREELDAVYQTDGCVDPDDFGYIGSEVAGRLIGMSLRDKLT